MFEYAGVKSRSYFHSVPPVGYDPDDPAAYYLNFEERADYGGPFDADGIPLQPTEDGRALPFATMIAMYGLGQCERYRTKGGVQQLNEFRKAVYWMEANQADDGSWPVLIPKAKYRLAPPYRSAMVQGLAISLLVRGAIIFESDRFLEIARKGLAPFGKSVAEGGVTTFGNDGPWYEEYPCDPARPVLNGFVYAMFGLYDLVRAEGNADAQRLWEAGLATLRKRLPAFDIGHWSLYQLPAEPENPATVAYHRLHINQLTVLADITRDPLLAEYRDRWTGYSLNPINGLRTLPAKLRWLGNDEF